MPDSVVFDRAAGYYDDTRGFPPGEEIPAAAMLARAGKLHTDSRLLEIGVGTGRVAIPLTAHVNTIVGVDLSVPMLQVLCGKASAGHIHAIHGDITRLPLPTAHFDAVLAVHIFHLVPGWQTALDEVARVLRPGGVLLNAWNEYHARNPEDEHLPEIYRAAIGSYPANVGVRHEHRDTFLDNTGWQPVGEPHAHNFTQIRTAGRFVELAENRIWSSSWRLTEAAHMRGMAAVRAAVAEDNIDLDRPMLYDASFNVKVYTKPIEKS